MTDKKVGDMDPKTLAKVAITFTFLPCIAFLVIFGSVTGQTAFIGVALAMISLLAVLWGNPLDKDT